MKFITGKIYHVFNRGVDKRNIFEQKIDYIRFIHNLYEFNNNKPAAEYSRSNVGSPTSHIDRNLLVDILAFCLMPNHFHLLVKQKVDRGASLFLQKLGVGYTLAFNQKYRRSGVLFQGKTKSVLVKTEEQLMHLPYYIHLNPLDLIFPGFKEKGIDNWNTATEYLNKYRWSSHLDYCDNDNFPSIINKSLRNNVWKSAMKYKADIRDWAKELNLNHVRNIILE